MEIFENGDVLYLCGRAKTEVFKYDDVMECLGSRALLRTYDSKTLRVDADFFTYGEKNLRFRKYPATCGCLNTIQERYVWTPITFKYGGKNLRFRKYPATCGRRFFLNTEEKISVFENTRLRVDEALS